MPVAVLDSHADSGALETAIADWESTVNPASIDHVDIEQVGSGRLLVTLIYTEGGA